MMADGLTFNTTRERRAFKRLIGQSNHFLITLLVGLDAVKQGLASPPPELHAPWNPRDVGRSAARSEDFALSAGLAWAVSALEGYVAAVRRTTLVSAELARKINEADESDGLRGRCAALGMFSGGPRPETALTALAVFWRNTVVHLGLRPRRFPPDLARTLREHMTEIASDYDGLDAEQAMMRADQARPPRWKETASLITAIHRFVQTVVAALLAAADHDIFAESLLTAYLFECEEKVASRFDNVWSKDISTRERTVRNVLLERGASPVERRDDSTLSEQWLSALAAMSVKEARLRFQVHRSVT
jgi:hypothetical protein